MSRPLHEREYEYEPVLVRARARNKTPPAKVSLEAEASELDSAAERPREVPRLHSLDPEQAVTSRLVPAEPAALAPAAPEASAADGPASVTDGPASAAAGAPVQAKFAAGRRADGRRATAGWEDLSAPASGGAPLPSGLRKRFELRGGVALDAVRVHRDSPRPAQIGARGFAHGLDIYLGPGEDEMLGHEAWHTVQQLRGQVVPTGLVAGVPINTDPALEAEADAAAAQGDDLLDAQPDAARDFGSVRPISLPSPTPIIQRFLSTLPGGFLVDEETGYEYREVRRDPDQILIERLDGQATVALDPLTMQPIETRDEADARRAPLSGESREQTAQRLVGWLTASNRSLSVRQRMVDGHRADRSLLQRVIQRVKVLREEQPERAAELDALRNYLQSSAGTAEYPRASLGWMERLSIEFDSDEVRAWLGSPEPVAGLSMTHSLNLVLARSRKTVDKDEPPPAVLDYLNGLSSEVVDRCAGAPLSIVSIELGVTASVAKDAISTSRRTWAESCLRDSARALVRRLSDANVRWDEIEPLALARLTSALEPAARRFSDVHRLLDLVRPHLPAASGAELAAAPDAVDRTAPAAREIDSRPALAQLMQEAIPNGSAAELLLVRAGHAALTDDGADELTEYVIRSLAESVAAKLDLPDDHDLMVCMRDNPHVTAVSRGLTAFADRHPSVRFAAVQPALELALTHRGSPAGRTYAALQLALVYRNGFNVDVDRDMLIAAGYQISPIARGAAPIVPGVDRITPLTEQAIADGQAARRLLLDGALAAGPQRAADQLAVHAARSVSLRVVAQSRKAGLDGLVAGASDEGQALGLGLRALDFRYPGAARAGLQAIADLAKPQHATLFARFLIVTAVGASIGPDIYNAILQGAGY